MLVARVRQLIPTRSRPWCGLRFPRNPRRDSHVSSIRSCRRLHNIPSPVRSRAIREVITTLAPVNPLEPERKMKENRPFTRAISSCFNNNWNNGVAVRKLLDTEQVRMKIVPFVAYWKDNVFRFLHNLWLKCHREYSVFTIHGSFSKFQK